MSQPADRIYRTKVDPLIVILLVAIMTVTTGVLFLIPTHGRQTIPVLIVVVACIWFVSFFFIWPVTYAIDGYGLTIRVGLIRKTVPTACIRAVVVKPDAPLNPMQGFKAAYSLDRLIIITDLPGVGAWISVSPLDKAGFLRDLQSRDAELRFQGEDLRRRSVSVTYRHPEVG